MKHTYILFFLIYLSFNSNATTPHNLKYSSLYVYDLGLEKMAIPERIELYKSMNYKGVTIPIRLMEHLQLLDRYLSAMKETSDFRLAAIYVPYDFDSKKEGVEVWEHVVERIKGTDIKLWPIFTGDGKREIAIAALQKMAKACNKANVTLVYYPHDGSYIESAEESLEFIKEAGVQNVYTSFHLCHELRAGNGDRLMEVAENVASYLALASISGANNQETYSGGNGWGDTIQPLEGSQYDLKKFLNALRSIGYDQELFLHTFGIKLNPQEHLKSSMDEWNKINLEL